MRNRLELRYAVEGDLRFISHHDSLRLFERALTRAGIPVRYSQGFNPRPRMRIALPRPVGVASVDELLLLELASQVPPSEVLSRLSSQVPQGVTLLSAERLADADRRLPSEVRYVLELEPVMASGVAERVARFMFEDCIEVERTEPKTRSSKKVDIRQYVLAMGVEDDRLTWTQAITEAGTARVGEILDAVGLPSQRYLHRLLRAGVSYRP